MIPSYLHKSIFYLSGCAEISVFILLIAALIAFQKSKPNFGIEIVWAVVPFVMLFVMMIPVANMFIYQQQKTPAVMITALAEESKV